MEKIDSLLKSNQTYKETIAQGKQWTDSSFAHDGSVVKGIEEVSGWARASQLFKGREKVYESFAAEDIEQGVLGDCYFLAAIAALAEFPGRVEKLFLQKERNEAGCYAVRLFINGQFVDIVVDDYFPVNSYKQPAFAGSKNQELWVMLLEKAWAKIHGDFYIIEGGDSRESLAAITGAPAEYHKHQNYTTEELWKLIKMSDTENFIMCTGTSSETKGLVRAHAYTLINAYEFDHQGEHVRLVQIRNPWASTEWTGAWSDNDSRWTPELRKKFNHTSKDDGIFFMPFADFAKIFIHTFLCRARDEYVHSSLSLRGEKAITMCKVERPTKGYISAYQFTPRLGEILASGYKITQMKLELYKYDVEKKTLVPLKGGYNNALGQANLEVEWDKGLYVVSATFMGATKLPHITFSSYTDVQVQFAELKVQSLSEITEEKLKEAFLSLKTKYGTEKHQRRRAGAFRNCLRGHRLNWDTEAYSGKKTFRCENCQKDFPFKAGYWGCKECSYEICPTCRPKNIGKEGKEGKEGRDRKDGKDKKKRKEDEKEEEKSEPARCGKGDAMKFEVREEEGDIFLCDNCGQAYFSSVARWCCVECNMDICRNCFAAPPSFKSVNEVLEINTCYNGYELEFIFSETRSGMYECFICAKKGDTHNGRWSCSECGINICHICKPSDKAKDGTLTVQTKLCVCDKGHLLKCGCSPPKPGTYFCCDKCEGPVKPDNWRWTCEECDYDICINCRPELEGRRDLICPNMHKLTYSELPESGAKYGRCDYCFKAFKFSTGTYCCTPCNYTYCKKCIEKVAKANS
eukprot:TRINITY_DN6845_c0_g2_i2.p1 TRINITY_DN6845_c0_g2~~TRINITY_DN6845_c0_g2_i2.p1  ORF type:complete len:802 (-),score=268.47 TRINITY_DN6845_c0_g2_i2:162-2567(-)